MCIYIHQRTHTHRAPLGPGGSNITPAIMPTFGQGRRLLIRPSQSIALSGACRERPRQRVRVTTCVRKQVVPQTKIQKNREHVRPGQGWGRGPERPVLLCQVAVAVSLRLICHTSCPSRPARLLVAPTAMKYLLLVQVWPFFSQALDYIYSEACSTVVSSFPSALLFFGSVH